MRELQNVIERALITSPEGRLELGGMLGTPKERTATAKEEQRILTEKELDELQTANIKRALADQQTHTQ